MRIASAASSGGSLQSLLEKVVPAAREQIGDASPDLGVFFASSHFEDEMARAATSIQKETGVRNLLGCTAEGVIGPAHEHEREPCLTLWLAHLPGCTIKPFHLTQADIESASSAEEWRRRLAVGEEARPHFIVLGDPFSIDANAMLGDINQHLPGRPVVGGMASGAEAPGQSALVLNDETHREGAVGVMLAGQLSVHTVVSQGCRPIGRPFVITRAEQNVILQLGGKNPLAVLNEIYAEAPVRDQQLMQQGLFLGRVINEQQEEFRRGDFLIRNLVGADQESGAIAIGDLVRVGSTVQFHVRDAASADEDLRALLGPQASPPPAGALLFSCNGRGTRMFKERDHDVGVLRHTLGPIPVVGFFCAGELGPVGGKNFIHGHTASIALFRPA